MPKAPKKNFGWVYKNSGYCFVVSVPPRGGGQFHLVTVPRGVGANHGGDRHVGAGYVEAQHAVCRMSRLADFRRLCFR